MTADASGVFPQIFAVEGTVLDLVLKTAGGVTLYTQDDVVASGASSGTISRDFTNSRFLLSGAGGVISLEAGDPTGDDVGGQMRLGGYNGTQADSISIDGAAVNVTGKLKEGGKKQPGVVYTEATTFTAVAQVDIALPNDPVGCRAYDIEIFDLLSSAAADIRALLSFDGGANYAAGASDYRALTLSTSGAAGNVSASAIAAAAFIFLGYSSQSFANNTSYGRIRIMTARSGNDATRVMSRFSGIISSTDFRIVEAEAMGPTSSGPADHIRLLPNSGTITGKYRVMPLRGFGEV